MKNMNHLTNEMRAVGAINAAHKIYYCEKCGTIASGNRMVSHHLANECNGIQGRKGKVSTIKNAHRLEEAKANTKEWIAEKYNDQINKLRKEARRRFEKDMEELQKINADVMEDAYDSYYKKIF